MIATVDFILILEKKIFLGSHEGCEYFNLKIKFLFFSNDVEDVNSKTNS